MKQTFEISSENREYIKWIKEVRDIPLKYTINRAISELRKQNEEFQKYKDSKGKLTC